MQALEDQQDIPTLMEGSEGHLSAIPSLKTMSTFVEFE